MRRRDTHIICVILMLCVMWCNSAFASDQQLLVQSTTSTANSGLYRFLLPNFEKETGIKVNVVAVGTGQALQNARNCDGDVLLVHAKKAEQKFVEEGYGVQRFDLMYNDFIIIGPKTNPAGISSEDGVNKALQRIAESNSLFASRGDNSGTHKKEQALWDAIFPNTEISEKSWYRSTGSGMGATINTAIGLGAYTLTDRATWISFNNKQDFTLLLEGDSVLFNQYGVTMVNPKKCASVPAHTAQVFIDWLLSKDTQQLISEFTIDSQQLFYPNAD